MVSEDSALIGKLADHDLKAQDVVLFAPQGNKPPPTVPRWQQFHYFGDFKDPDADILIGEDFYVQQPTRLTYSARETGCMPHLGNAR
ncbi:hypothetical protein, partial [Arthrobacter methylotrophus]